MKSKVRCRLPSGLASVILHDTFFLFFLSHSFSSLHLQVRPFQAGKFCRCYINSSSSGRGVRKKGRQEGEKQDKSWAYCGKMRHKDKKDLERVKPVSSGTSKKLLFIRSWRKEEEQKSGRKLEAEWRQLSSSHPKSLEERQGGKTKNKALNGSAVSRAPAETLVEPARSLLIQKRDPALDQCQPDMSSCWKDVFFVNTNPLWHWWSRILLYGLAGSDPCFYFLSLKRCALLALFLISNLPAKHSWWPKHNFERPKNFLTFCWMYAPCWMAEQSMSY